MVGKEGMVVFRVEIKKPKNYAKILFLQATLRQTLKDTHDMKGVVALVQKNYLAQVVQVVVLYG